jgi:hypothetical protein
VTVGSLRGAWLVVTILLLGVMASGADAAVGHPATAPIMIGGSTAGSDMPSGEDGASIVLRGSTPPPPPPTTSYVCPPGDTYASNVGCGLPDEASYADQSDYGWDWQPYDFSNRHRIFRPHRRAFHSIAHGFVRSGRIGRR